jgi:hypothetical protein
VSACGVPIIRINENKNVCSICSKWVSILLQLLHLHHEDGSRKIVRKLVFYLRTTWRHKPEDNDLNSPPASKEAKNPWSYTSTPSFIFMECGNSTFICWPHNYLFTFSYSSPCSFIILWDFWRSSSWIQPLALYFRCVCVLVYTHTHTHTHESISKSFRTESIKKYTFTFGITRSEATQRIMAAKLNRLTHKIAIQMHLVAESCTICNCRSRRPVRKIWIPPRARACVCVSSLIGYKMRNAYKV